MFRNAQISSQLGTMIAAIKVPVLPPITEILVRASRSTPLPIRHSAPPARTVVAAAIVVAIVLAATPIMAPGFVQTLESRIAQLLQWTPPPDAPESVNSAIASRLVSLRTAQALVRFRIVPPVGLPRDVVSEKIFATPTAVYSKNKHAWTVGPPSLTFLYRRGSGRTFALLADSFDPRASMPPKYIFDADHIGPSGLPERHERFAWRNGNQTMSASEDDAISAAEIQAIRSAMHGIPLRPASTRAELNSGTIVKKYRLP